ncbi:MAG TPA: hypothetical protein VFY05_00355 [Candidatus Angelobacter sp.]|nr:hypothetical protein [Candidatus Angelobacter sp.]
MYRFFAAMLVILPAVSLGQPAQTDSGTTPKSIKPTKLASDNSQSFNLADLLTNARLKIQKIGCSNDLDAVEAEVKALEAKTAAQRDKLTKKAEESEKHEAKEPCSIDGSGGYFSVAGIWESEVPGVSLMSPEQVWIECDVQEKHCRALRVSFDLDQLGVSVRGPDETDYQVASWDDKGLFATHDPDFMDKCHRSLLTVSFASGDVSISDVPTHEKGCEIFTDTNSYRLIRGNYYIDTTRNNDSPAVPK